VGPTYEVKQKASLLFFSGFGFRFSVFGFWGRGGDGPEMIFFEKKIKIKKNVACASFSEKKNVAQEEQKKKWRPLGSTRASCRTCV
jgi:hypothetical protein